MKNQRAFDLLTAHMGTCHAEGTKRAFIPNRMPADPAPENVQFTLSYMDAYGYLEKELAQWADISIGDIIEAIKALQAQFGHVATGEVTTQTLRAMQLPRCGCPDIIRPWHQGFATAQPLNKWTKTSLTYAIQNYVPGLPQAAFEQMIFDAFQIWTQYARIDVRPVPAGGRPDIVIGTGSGKQEQFDGPNGVLAWCYLPNGSDQQIQMKFDLAENWLLSPTEAGILIANVARHELGHGFGLTHSKVQSALMAPYYNPAVSIPQQNDDIPRLVARYGARQGTPQPPQPAPPQPPQPPKPPLPPVPPTPTVNVITIQAEGRIAIDLNGKRIG